MKALDEQGQPVISVETKKKSLSDSTSIRGNLIAPRVTPIKVNDHDFPDEELGKVAPYGVYDLKNNEAWVNLDTDHDTAAFAVESIRRCYMMARKVYSYATKLLINVDSGGSNGARVRFWKVESQRFANETGLEMYVSHFPPGTSKWNKIEHRLFCALSLNWCGRTLINHEVIVNLIQTTTTKTGLKVRALLDTNFYTKGIKVADTEIKALNYQPESFLSEWNYSIKKYC